MAQDWVKTGTGLGVEKVRLAVPDFKPSSTDAQNAALLKTFNDTLWNDLDVSGIVRLGFEELLSHRRFRDSRRR